MIKNTRKAIFLLVSLFSSSSKAQFKCDSIENSTCFVTSVQEFAEVTITESSIGDGKTIIDELVIASGGKLRCFTDLCFISIQGFKRLHVEGTIVGSHIIIDVTDEVEVSLSGWIHGNLRGNANTKGGGAGSGSCGYASSNYIGASYGGQGGVQCGSSRPRKPTYSSEDIPSEYGSGGDCNGAEGSGGGKMSLDAENKIIVNGRIEENGSEGHGNGALGSGGSILLRAEEILGSGFIRAEGGTCTQASGRCAAGGGGQIALYSNKQEGIKGLTISAAGGNDLEGCDVAKGLDGTVKQFCLTSTCYNGGESISNGCGCDCISPWAGPECKDCTMQCKNGSTLMSTCSCNCPRGWKGVDCSECDDGVLCSGHGTCNDSTLKCSCFDDYYGSKCDIECNPTNTCKGKGLCSEEGVCVCAGGFVGETCDCPAATSSDSDACSGNGVVGDKGECYCSSGFVGCGCENECSGCSGNGKCARDGSCNCNFGWFGDNCDEQDIPLYCSNATIKCLPGITNTLGYGFDPLTGEQTIQLFNMRYTGRTETIDGERYQIPDGVTCKERNEYNQVFVTNSYQGTLKYRLALSSSAGLSGRFKPAMFTLSNEYEKSLDTGFLFDRTLFFSELSKDVFECKFTDIQDLQLTSKALKVNNTSGGSKRIASLGAYAITSAIFGGRISITNYVESCVFKSTSKKSVKTEVDASLFSLAKSVSAEASVESQIVDECSDYVRNSYFRKNVKGGDGALLIASVGDSVADFHKWFDSVAKRPSVISQSVRETDFFIPELEDDVMNYLKHNDEINEFESVEGAVACDDRCGDEEDTSSGAIPLKKFLQLEALLASVLVMVMICVAC